MRSLVITAGERKHDNKVDFEDQFHVRPSDLTKHLMQKYITNNVGEYLPFHSYDICLAGYSEQLTAAVFPKRKRYTSLKSAVYIVSYIHATHRKAVRQKLH